MTNKTTRKTVTAKSAKAKPASRKPRVSKTKNQAANHAIMDAIEQAVPPTPSMVEVLPNKAKVVDEVDSTLPSDLTLRTLLIKAYTVQEDMNEAEQEAKGISNLLLRLAHRHCDAKGMLRRDEFLGACGVAETSAKTELGETKLPACWKQAKSNIKKASESGIAIASYSTESSMRKALNKLRKANNALAIESAIEQEQAIIATTAPKTVKRNSDISGILAALAALYDSVDEDEQDKFKAELVRIHAQYRKSLADIIDGSRKQAALAPAVHPRETATASASAIS